jgi:putative membrane protein
MRPMFAIGGWGMLAVAWLGPLPGMATHSFAAHMTLHMVVVAIAAPLIAIGLAGAHGIQFRKRRGGLRPFQFRSSS